MIVPSIDIQQGRAVQLIGGKIKALDAGDPLAIAERFSVAGEIAVIDLDAAMGKGSNASVIENIARNFPVRVGGGIRDIATAIRWLDAGAEKIIIGTKAEPDFLCKLPKERLIVALDSDNGTVMVNGWQSKTECTIQARIRELRNFVSGFLITFIEREGRQQGTAIDAVDELVKLSGPVRVTIAGGICTKEEIRYLDELGADAQVGMALYTDQMSLAECISAPLRNPVNDLWPTVVVDERGTALGLAWSNLESLRIAVEERRGIYYSRRRGLWRKGEISGASQELLKVTLDCDRDSLRFTVRQMGSGFCHNHSRTCWGEDGGISALYRTIENRKTAAPENSYTWRLFSENGLLEAKLLEETRELIHESAPERVTEEAADLFYFTLVKLSKSGVSLTALETELDRRRKMISRRQGDAKIENYKISRS